MVVAKPKGTVQLCLDPVKLNQALIRSVMRSPTLNDILPRLTQMQYLTLIDASSGYHNLTLDKISSYLRTFACKFHKYKYTRFPFSATPAGNMFQ